MSTLGFLTEESWLAARRQYVTSSDAPCLLGIGFGKRSAPVHSPYELWLEKTGRVPPSPPSDSLRLKVGLMLEPLCAQEHMRLHPEGAYTFPGRTLYTNGWRACTPDGLKYEPRTNNLIGGVEFKTVSHADDWQDGPSSYAIVQSHHHMLVTGTDTWEIGALFGLGERYQEWTIARNPELMASLEEAEEKFWQCVQSDTPPEMDGYHATRRAIEAMYPKPEPGKEVSIHGLAGAYLHRQELVEARDRLQQKIDAYDNALRLAIGDAEIAYVLDDAGVPIAKYTYKVVTVKEHVRRESSSRQLREVKL